MPALGMGLGVPKGSFGDSGLLLDELNESMNVAFSLRKVRTDYNGPCVRVRNNAGTLKDIGFLSNGRIDEAALNAHCGANDGTVQTWYNQSAKGGRFNAVQDTAADQPIIYDASEGGYLGYVENTGNRYLRFENQLTGVTDTAIVYEHVTNTDHPFLLGAEDEDVNHGIVVNRNVSGVDGFALQAGSGQTISTHTGDTIGEKFASFIYTGGTDKFISVNGYVAGEGAVTDSIDLDLIFTRDVASGGSEDNNDFVGKIWEVFLSTSDLSGDRIAIENSILSANGLTVPEQTLLEKYDGAEGAFSTRCINREHVGPILRVRNEVDHALRVVVDEDDLGNTDSVIGIAKTVAGVSNADTSYTVTFEVYADCPSVTGNVNLSGQVAGATRATTPTSVAQNQWVSVSIDSGANPDNGLFRVYFAGTNLQSLDSGDRIYFRNFDYDHANGSGDAVSYESDFSSGVDGFSKQGTESGDFTLSGGGESAANRNVYLQSDGTVNTTRIEELCTVATDKFDGFVQTWYDQSSFGYDVTNTTTAQQPKIYDETDGIVLLNGQPAVEFDGSNDILESSSQNINLEAIIAVASTNDESETGQHILRHGQGFIRFDGTNKIEYRNNVNLRDDSANNFLGLTNDNAVLVSWYTKGTDFNDENSSWKWYVNGDLLGTKTGNNLSSEGGTIKLGAQSPTSGSEQLNGKICEAIIIDRRDAQYDRADQIHKDINSHYLIYQEVDATTGFISNSAYNVKLAHSVRKLSGSLLCCQVQRSSDNAIRNIGWASDGFVDTEAIKDFCGTSSGKILVVYDQSEGGYDAFASPLYTNYLWIYDGTDIYTSNGRPAFYQKDASTTARYEYSYLGRYPGPASDKYYYDEQTKASYSVVCGPVSENTDNGVDSDYMFTTADLTVYRNASQRLRADIFDSGEGLAPSMTTADAATRQRVIMAGGTLGGIVWGHIDDSEDNDNVDSPEGWLSTPGNHRIDIFFQSEPTSGDNPYLQESIFYDNDFRVEGTLESLKTEINSAFDTFASDETPTSGFLSEFSGASAAYSVRKLGDSPVAMRVRKTVSSVDYYQVIGFDSNGDLDTAAIEEFGGSADVHVQTWYDQSGNGRHQVQDTNAEQPKIYDGTDGFYYTEGNVAIYFDGQGMEDSSDNQITVLDQSVFAVAERRNNSNTDRDVFVGHSDSGTYQVYTAQVWGAAGADRMVNYAGNSEADLAFVSVSLDTKRNLRTYGWHHDTDTIFQYNGEEFAPDSGSNDTLAPTQTTYQISVGSNSYNSLHAYLTEVIVYEGMRDATTRTNIEKNQNEHFLVHQSASTSPATGLLADHPAEAAFSVRQLGDALLCMKVASGATGNPTKNIGFKNGVLDTAAIEEFCGNNDGFVATWYDQSGNDRNGSQSTHANRPKIFDSQSGVVKQNSKPAVSFDGTNDSLGTSYDAGNTYTAFWVQDSLDGDGGQVLGKGDGSGRHVVGRNESNQVFLYRGGTTAATDLMKDDQIVGFALSVSTQGDCLVGANGNTGTSSTTVGTSTLSDMTIGAELSSVSFYGNTDIQEIILYTSDKSSDRSVIESNINGYYKAFKNFTTGLLDSYPGATAAYSLRRLSSTYTGPAIELVSDSGTDDIGFDPQGRLDLESLETKAGSNDARISKWYDQSGNGNDLVQETANDRPKIYDGSDGLVKISDEPAVEFYESNNKFLESSSNITVDDFFVLNVIKKSGHAGGDTLWAFGTSGDTEFQQLANLNNGEDYYIRRDNGSGTNVNSYIGRQVDFEGPHNVVSLSYDQTNPVLRINGKVEWDTDASDVYGADDQRIVLGNNPQENAGFRGKQQEFLVYPSDMRTKVAGIEKNINKHYKIYEQPLLDVVTGAKVAYSLRRLRSEYTGPAINVFNGTDYKDIYFKANGTLDTNAISKFCGSNDGRVHIWYDQSGNQNNATRDLNSARPKIYDGTNGILTDNNGKVTLEFVVDTLPLDSEIVLNSNDPDKFMISMVAESIPSTTNDKGEYFGEGPLNFLSYGEVSGKYRFRHTTTTDGNVNTDFEEPSGNSEDEIAAFFLYAANDVKNMRFNNEDLTSSGGTAWSDSSNGVIKIDTVGRAYARDYSGMYSEFIVWDDYGTGLALVHPNQNHYYSIY